MGQGDSQGARTTRSLPGKADSGQKATPPTEFAQPAESSSLLERLDYLLRAVNRRLNGVTRSRLGEFGLTLPRFHVLLALGRCGPMSMGQLQEQLNQSPSSITELVDGLVNGGLVERERTSEDRRVVVVRLTPAGQTTLARLKGFRLEALKEALEQVSPPACQAAVEVLEQLEKALGGAGAPTAAAPSE